MTSYQKGLQGSTSVKASHLFGFVVAVSALHE